MLSFVSLLVMAAAPHHSYEHAYKNAVQDQLPQVTFVNCTVTPIDGTWCCHAGSLEGYPSECVVISVPQGNKMIWLQTLPAKATKADIAAALPKQHDALDEVNAKRVARGLHPFIKDSGLTIAAINCAKHRAANRIAGHSNDFSFVPSGSVATAAGCGAMDASWGWQSCCWEENYTYAGAAVVIGDDGNRYMHIFVR